MIKFEMPEMEIEKFEMMDVITTSTCDDDYVCDNFTGFN
jgi:hypothetical protein